MAFRNLLSTRALAATLIAIQLGLPAGANESAGLGQSEWMSTSSPAGSSAGLGQSEWMSTSSPAGSSAGLGQSEWMSAGSSAGSSAGLGQSEWMSAGQPQSKSQASASHLGQSQWMSVSNGPSPVANHGSNAGLGQSQWMSASQPPASSGAHGAVTSVGSGQSQWMPVPQQARDGFNTVSTPAPAGGQAQWAGGSHAGSAQQAGMMVSATAVPHSPAPTELTCAATAIPTRLSEQSPAVELTGSVSQVDIVGDSLGNLPAYQPASMPAAPSYQPSALPQMPAAQQDFSSAPAGSGVPAERAGTPMGLDEMMASAMMVPMMMATQAGLVGQSFPSFGARVGGGFRGYGPGAVRIGPGTAGIGLAGYMVGRMARQASRQALRGLR